MRAEGTVRPAGALCGAALLGSLWACGPAPVPTALLESPAEAPPSGDTCDDPRPLPLGELVLGTTLGGAHDTVRPRCASGTAPERIFHFRVETRSQFRAMLQGDFDAVLALRNGCGDEAGELACNDDVRGGQSQRSRVEATLSPGDHYLIVDGSRGGAGDFELFAFLEPIESPELACEAATELTLGQTVRGSTLGMPDRFQATCGQGATAGERVFRFELEQPSRLRVLQQTEYDGVLYLRSQCELPVSELACNDDFRGSHRSMLTTRLDPGTYFLFSDGLEKPQEGTFSLRAEAGPLEPSTESASDVCDAARALPIEPGTVELDTFHEVSRQAASCGGEGAPESVYALEVTAPSRLRVRLRAPEFNAVLYLREHCENPDTELACERQARVDRRLPRGASPARSLDVEVAAGIHYLFIDGRRADDFGAAQLQVDLWPLSELDALCQQAPDLHDGDVIEGRLEQARSKFAASCAGEARGPEDVYQLRLRQRARVQLELDSSFDGVLYLRRECSRIESEVACNDDTGHSRRSSVTEVLEPGTYQVFVDGFHPRDLGPYRLRAQIAPVR